MLANGAFDEHHYLAIGSDILYCLYLIPSLGYVAQQSLLGLLSWCHASQGSAIQLKLDESYVDEIYGRVILSVFWLKDSEPREWSQLWSQVWQATIFSIRPTQPATLKFL